MIHGMNTARAVIRSGCMCLIAVSTACARPDARAATSGAVVLAAEDEERAARTIDAAGMHARIGLLASDLLGGRSTPSPGLDLAAAYIASEFESLGLRPAGETFILPYPLGTGVNAPRAPNVAAVLTGSDPVLRDTWVVYSAHMDHLGTGPADARGDSIYNGADDDASGTSAVLEIAEAFASLGQRPARSILFLTVSGEELGLLGSEAFLASGVVPVQRIVANVNIDMIGRNAADSIVAIGMPYSALGTMVDSIARARAGLGLAILDDPWPDEQFFFRSDHFNFARSGVPALFFFAGVHEDYHRPSDHVERIDADKAARVARLAFHLGYAVATAAAAPEWTPLGRREVLGTGGS